MTPTPRSFTRTAPWLIAAAILFAPAALRAADDGSTDAGDIFINRKLTWGEQAQLKMPGTGLPVTLASPSMSQSPKADLVPFWTYLTAHEHLDEGNWDVMTLHDQNALFKKHISAAYNANAAYVASLEDMSSCLDKAQSAGSDMSKAGIVTKCRARNKKNVDTVVAAFGADSDQAKTLTSRQDELFKMEKQSFGSLNQAQQKKVSQDAVKYSKGLKASSESEAKAASDQAFENSSGKTGKSKGYKQARSAAVLSNTNGPGGAVLKGPESAAKGDMGSVKPIEKPKEEKGFFGKLWDGIKSVPLPVWTALGGAVIGLAVGGVKGMLIGAGGGLVLGLGIGLLKDALGPKNEYQKQIQDNNSSISDVEKKQNSLASETTDWQHQMNSVEQGKASTSMALNGGTDPATGTHIVGVKEQQESLMTQLQKGQISRAQFNTKMDTLDTQTRSLNEHMDDLNRQEANLETQRPQMAKNIEEFDKLEVQKKKLQESNASLGVKDKDITERNRLRSESTSKVDEAKSLRSQAADLNASAGSAPSFEAGNKMREEAAQKVKLAEQREKEAKADVVSADKIDASYDPARTKAKPDPVAEKKQKEEMKRAALMASPKYDYTKDPELGKRYKDCNEAQAGSECTMGKAAADLQKRARPGTKDTEVGRKLAQCAETVHQSQTDLDGCGNAMLYYRQGDPKLAANVPKARGLASLFSSPKIYYQDAAGIAHKEDQEERIRMGRGATDDRPPDTITQTVWTCRDGKPYYRGKLQPGSNCSESN